eukprot:CAMPEP_0170785304 /NCGR_PEP_ID=MMETSP0733-20121128/16817_1 /TAXON_ID=186038 /ORGANISM="Fragilariopsis kerguelensis, Strain L26-C5" /LENGTH=239 /DNA_ID=CAMNT_0011130713 /DNA_START=136 /DNA_END=855 /DNA_ORIENTATION=-
MISNISKSTATSVPRGAFIVLEGVDRCGKTTQASLLIKHLVGLGLAATAMRFPDRTTMVGDLINQYLQSKSELDDRAVHLLFSANRWEAAPSLRRTLVEEGANVICDRYAHSGVAFSSAKPSLEENLDWCRACDVGLPAPDAVIFLDLSQEEAEQRGGYVGGERYEKKEMQQRVRKRFSQLQEMDESDGQIPWYVVNAAQTIEDVQKEINNIVEKTVERVNREEVPVGLLWKKQLETKG